MNGTEHRPPWGSRSAWPDSLHEVLTRGGRGHRTRRVRPTTARQALALPGRQILQRGDLGRVVLLALGWPAPTPRPLGRRRRLPLAGTRRIDLAHGDEAVPSTVSRVRPRLEAARGGAAVAGSRGLQPSRQGESGRAFVSPAVLGALRASSPMTGSWSTGHWHCLDAGFPCHRTPVLAGVR